jgi:hypothetical protein
MNRLFSRMMARLVVVVTCLSLAATANSYVLVEKPENSSAVIHAQSKARFLDRPRKARPYCGQLGCSWCCVNPSGSSSCRQFTRCGGSCGHFHCK